MTSLVRRTSLPLMGTFRHPLGLFERPSSLADTFDRLVSDMWETWEPSRLAGEMLPRIDMWEEKDELMVRAELPGLEEKDIDISIEEGVLTLKAERAQEEATEDKTYYHCERSFGRFTRTIGLPYPVQTDKVTASFDKGVLDIRLPKAEEAKAKHVKIEIK